MHSVSLTLFLLGLLAGAISAEDAPSCASQHEASMKCVLALKSSDEVMLIKAQKKKILPLCAPNYPQSCLERWDAMDACCKELESEDKMKDDPELMDVMNKTKSEIDECFETKPSNPLAGLEEIFMPPMMKMGGKGKRGPPPPPGMPPRDMDMLSAPVNDTSAPGNGEKSGEKSGGRSGGKSDEKSGSQSDEKSNSTGGSRSREHSGEATPPPELFHPECMKTPAQMDCLMKEMKTLLAQPVLRLALESLIKKKDECKAKVKQECALSTRPLKKCFWRAHKRMFAKILEKVATCVKGKMGSGAANSTSSSSGTGGDSLISALSPEGGAPIAVEPGVGGGGVVPAPSPDTPPSGGAGGGPAPPIGGSGGGVSAPSPEGIATPPNGETGSGAAPPVSGGDPEIRKIESAKAESKAGEKPKDSSPPPVHNSTSHEATSRHRRN